MTERHIARSNASPKRVPIQDRAFTMGELTGINGYHANRTLLKQRFAEGGYQVHETDHFLLFTRVEAPTSILVHWFPPQAINANIGDYFMRELKPLGIFTHTHTFGDVFGVVVCSLFPRDPQRALYLYGTNTLRRYQQLLDDAGGESSPPSTIHAFTTVYRRVFQLLAGESFLDVGCSFGFLPLLIAQAFPSLTQVVGIDIQTEPFTIVRSMAEELHLKNIHFCQADVLADSLSTIGHFDTVVALHLLEHLIEAHMYLALGNLLKLTSRRLIIAVPYEEHEPEAIYGHEQLFTREHLEMVGAWCLQQLGGGGRVSYEECAGGLLVIERTSTHPHDPWSRTNQSAKKT